MINSQLRAYLKRMTGEFLTDTCTITREVETVGDTYTPVKTTVTVASHVACRIIQPSPRATNAGMIVAGQETLTDEYSLIVPATVTLDVNYKVVCGGLTYSITKLETAWTDEPFRKATMTRQR